MGRQEGFEEIQGSAVGGITHRHLHPSPMATCRHRANTACGMTACQPGTSHLRSGGNLGGIPTPPYFGPLAFLASLSTSTTTPRLPTRLTTPATQSLRFCLDEGGGSSRQRRQRRGRRNAHRVSLGSS